MEENEKKDPEIENKDSSSDPGLPLDISEDKNEAESTEYQKGITETQTAEPNPIQTQPENDGFEPRVVPPQQETPYQGYNYNPYNGAPYNGNAYYGNYYSQQRQAPVYHPQSIYPSMPPAPAPKKNKKGTTVLIAVLCSLLAICLICGSVFAGLYLSDAFKSLINDGQHDDGGGDNGGDNGGGNGGGSGNGDESGGNPTNPGNQTNGGVLPSDSTVLFPNFDITQIETPGQKHASLSDAYDATAATVVSITVATGEGTSAGSGVIIGKMSEDRGYYVVTNNHVVDGARSISIKLNDGRTYNAHTTILTDPMSDLAVIAIATTDTFSVAKVGQSADVRVGEDIFVIGNPLGTLGGTLTNGIISAQAVKIFVADHYMTLLQTNAAVNPGNSGGAMFNMSGELIGIVNAKYADVNVEGIGFAIPTDTAVPIIEQMISQGYVTGRHVLGITVSYDTRYNVSGLWLTGMSNDSALATAGFTPSSSRYYLIESIDGETFSSITEAIAYLDTLKAGDTSKFKITEYSVTANGFFGGTFNKGETTEYDVRLVQKSAIVDIS
jgi:serine protease Do